MIPMEIDANLPDLRSYGSSNSDPCELEKTSSNAATATGADRASAPGMKSTSLEALTHERAGAGVYGPAQTDRVHVHFRIMEICLECGEYVSLDHFYPVGQSLGSNLERGSWPDEMLSNELLMGCSVCTLSF